MIKREVLAGRVYKAEGDGSCVSCGKKNRELDSVIETTYIFEHCSLKAILQQIKEYFDSGYYEGGTAKISIAIVEQPIRRDEE